MPRRGMTSNRFAKHLTAVSFKKQNASEISEAFYYKQLTNLFWFRASFTAVGREACSEVRPVSGVPISSTRYKKDFNRVAWIVWVGPTDIYRITGVVFDFTFGKGFALEYRSLGRRSVVRVLIRLSPLKIIGNILPELIGCGIMVTITWLLSSYCDTIISQTISMTICLAAYSGFILAIKKERLILRNIWQHTAKSIMGEL